MNDKSEAFGRFFADLNTFAPGESAELLLRQLEPDIAAQVRLCAIPHQFSPGILEALIPSLGKDNAQVRFAQFAKLSIMLPGVDMIGQETLAMHDSARHHLFAQWLSPARSGEFADASRRLVEYFEMRMRDAAGERLELLERRCMFHLLGAEQDRGMDEFERMFRQNRFEFRLSECETLSKLVLEYESVLTPLNAGRLAYQQAKLATDRRQWSVAQQLLERMLENPALPPELHFKAYNRLGTVFAEQRDSVAAIARYQRALQLGQATPACADFLYRTYHELGVAYRESAQWSQARKFLQKSIELAGQRQDFSGLAVCYTSLGTFHRKLGESNEAIAAYEKSLEYLERAHDKFRCAEVYNQLGMTYAEINDWQKSQQFLTRSIEIKCEAGDLRGQAMTLNNLVRIYRSLSMPQKAIESAQQSVALFQEAFDFYGAAQAQRNLGKVYVHVKNYELSRKAFETAIELFRRCVALEDAELTAFELEALGRKDKLWWWLIATVVLAIIITCLLLQCAAGGGLSASF